MSNAVRLNATMDEDLLGRLDAYARDHYEDRSTALRQLVDFALRELRKRDALKGVPERPGDSPRVRAGARAGDLGSSRPAPGGGG